MEKSKRDYMSTFKKMAIVTLVVGNSISALAGSLDLNDNQTWRVGAQALYLKPSFGGNGLGYSSFSNYGSDFFNNQVEVNGAPNYLSNIQPKHDWGYQVEAGYGFCKSNDLDVNWYHFDNSTRGHLPQGTLFAGSASALYAGAINVSPRWDAVNIELGQRIDFNDLQTLRLHAGVEFVRIKNTFINYPQLTPKGSPLFITQDQISYNGFGPRIGADFIYGVGGGFGFYAKGAAGLLVGRAKQTVSGYHDLTGFNLYSTGNYTQSNNSVVVTELEGKLGLKFDLKMSQGILGFDLGYLWITYLDALVSQVGSGVVSSSISNSSAANFDLNGLYFGLKWTGNI